MTADREQAIEAIRQCRKLRKSGKPEAALRNEMASRLRRIFPSAEDEAWINRYTMGTETHAQVGKEGGRVVNRFIDNLVGATTIEYEADLRVTSKYETGLAQVGEHIAGLLRRGVPETQVRGILSDTVEWHVFEPQLKKGVDPAACADVDIELTRLEKLDLTAADELNAGRLIGFFRRNLAREQSRPLGAEALAVDLGLESSPYRRNAAPMAILIRSARCSDPSVALATNLWSEFVDHLETSGSDFRAATYVDEAYLLVLARLLSANVLARRALLSDDEDLRAILNGSYFRNRYWLENMAESDYFGWLSRPKHFPSLAPAAREIQRDLYAYDFSQGPDEDLFGQLMSQLARRSQRKLLGQEPTPAWLAKLLATRCLESRPAEEQPRIVDMCCGSGTILIEVIRAAKLHRELSGIDALRDVATGFDIDPLAVSISKTNWVVALADEIKAATGSVTIPVYHADSLFAVTPVSTALPLHGDATEIALNLDGKEIPLPAALVHPDYRGLFDGIVDWAYDEACDIEGMKAGASPSPDDAASVVDGVAAATGISLAADFRAALVPAVCALANRMIELSADGRNGVWAFILRNTYRPGLLTGQFNGIVSNPPWLAMSGIADNPYRAQLTRRAQLYGIQPPGASFLHLELGTTHLLHAVDRYLSPGGSVACLVPGTIFNGHHHEPLRRSAFLASPRRVAFEISEVWKIAPGTFKYPGAAIIGSKSEQTRGFVTEPTAAVASSDGVVPADLSLLSTGTGRTAWVLERGGKAAAVDTSSPPPQQGADIMPRVAVCVEIRSSLGGQIRVDTPKRDSQYGYVLGAAKVLREARFPGVVAPQFVWKMAYSNNLLPYVFGNSRPPVVIPAIRDGERAWSVLSTTEIRRLGYRSSAIRFQEIDRALAASGKGESLHRRIDMRGKLSKQIFPSEGFLLMAGAGGKHTCAACIPVAEAKQLVIDQTLYWKVVRDSLETWFLVGMLNSRAMTDTIEPFNPKGSFGERHVHTLPYRLMPAFDPMNDVHTVIATRAQYAAELAREIVKLNPYLGDARKALSVRRSRLRDALVGEEPVRELEILCAQVLGTTPVVRSTADSDSEDTDRST